jgi:hypothetical protein
MRKRWIQIIRGLLIFIVVSASTTAAFAKEKPTVEELIARHLKAVGAPEKIAARKSCIAEGRGALPSLLADKGTLTVAAFMISEGDKLRFNLRIGAPNCPADQFAFDGSKVDTGVLTPRVGSQLGQFLYLHNFIVKEGLPSGVVSTAWPLFDLEKRGPRLRYGGLKKIEGKELHELKYMAKKGEGDLDVYLYFDPENYRHVRTTYYLIQPPPSGGRKPPPNQGEI